MLVLNFEAIYRYPEFEAGPEMDWGLLIRNISRQDGVQVTCSWEGNPGGHPIVSGSISVHWVQVVMSAV